MLAIVSVSCKKGDTGAQGPAGNANVKVFTYGTKTFTGSTTYPLPNVTQGMIDSSLVLAYYNPSAEPATSWYPVPGLGSGGLYETRFFVFQSSQNPVALSMSVRTMKPDGTGAYASAVTFTRFKIVIAPASEMIVGGRQARPVNYDDYYATMKYFNLPY